jgi:hypothetical protein
MPKDPVRYTPDKDEKMYEARKKMYISLGYEAHEDIGTIGKVCTLSFTRGSQVSKVVLTLLNETK